MSEGFRHILEQATKEAREWPEWKKSDALKRSERTLQSSACESKQDTNPIQTAKSAAAQE
jgi:hypothetical protein